MIVVVSRTVKTSGENIRYTSELGLMDGVRFQRKEYSDIEIVLTEKKGYGLRTQRDLPKSDMIH